MKTNQPQPEITSAEAAAEIIRRLQNPLRDTMMGTLIAWCFVNEVELRFCAVDNGPVISVPAKDGLEAAHIDVSMTGPWSYDMEIGVPYAEDNGGWLATPGELLTLLSRLSEEEGA